MRHFPILLLLLAFVACSLPACAQKPASPRAASKKISKRAARKAAKSAAKTPPAASPATASPVLTFERTPCFGTCPAYVMQVFADGRVAYDGRRGVPVLGPKELRLPAAAVANMLQMAKEAHFDQFQNRYSRGTTDLPSTVIAVRQPNGQLKTVTVEEGASANLTQFVTYLANQFDALAQLSGAEK